MADWIDPTTSLNNYNSRIPLTLDNIVYSLQKAGGASVYWANLHERIARDNRFSISVLEREDAVNNFIKCNCGFSYETVKAKYCLPKRIDQNRRLNIKGKTLFHSSCYRTSKGSGAINITTVHDFTCMRYYAGFLRDYSFWQIRRAVESSQALICISDSTKNDLLHFIPDACEKIIKVIPHACDEAYSYKGCSRKKQVVFIGNRNLAYKNFDLAVRAVAQNKRVKLMIIGAPLSDSERDELDKQLSGNYENVVYPSAAKIASIFNESIALLYLSEYEGFGIPILEGMASGVPVIATNKSSVPEVAGSAGILLENPTEKKVSDSINFLLNNDSHFCETVERGINQAQLFSWDRTAKETADFYCEVWERFN